MDVPSRDEFDALAKRMTDAEAALVALAGKVPTPNGAGGTTATPALPLLAWVAPKPGGALSAGPVDVMVRYSGWTPLNVEVSAGAQMVGRLTDDPVLGAFHGSIDLSMFAGLTTLQATSDPLPVYVKVPAAPAPSPTGTTDAPRQITSPLGASLKLAFHDEFDGVPAPDLGLDRYFDEALWIPTFWQGSGERTLKDNGEAQEYMDARYGGAGNIPVAQRPNPFKFYAPSVLTIESFPISQALWANYGLDQTRRFASGLLCSAGKFGFQYGYWETRIRLPANKGTWIAAWLLLESHAWPPEVDKFEYMGHRPTKHSSGIIVPKGEKLSTGADAGWFQMHDPALPLGDSLAAGWHTFGLEWTPTTMAFLVDGAIWARQPTPPSFIDKGPMYLLLNAAVGGNWYAQANEGNAPNAWTVDEASMPWRTDLDYTRVWV